jgi:hypothetical protein
MTRHIAWSPEAEKRLRRMRALGLSVSALAERFGASEDAIMAKLSRIKPKPHPSHPPYVPIVPVRMIVTPWFYDPNDGLQTRVVRGT